MRVKCISNKPEDGQSTDEYTGSGSGSNLDHYPLTVGDEYAVYAIANIGGEKMYLLIDDFNDETHKILRDMEAPRVMWYNASLFQVVDPTIDPTWQVSAQGSMWNEDEIIHSFPEFVSDENMFYTNLFEGEQKEIDIFKKYMRKYENPLDLDTEEGDRYRRQKKYEEGVRMAKERGWDMPEKPEDID